MSKIVKKLNTLNYIKEYKKTIIKEIEPTSIKKNVVFVIKKPKKVKLNSIITEDLMVDIKKFQKKYCLKITDALETLLTEGLKQFK